MKKLKSGTTEFRSILKEKFNEFSLNSEKWSHDDLFAWLELYEKGEFDKYKENLKQLFELEKLPKENHEKKLSKVSKAILNLLKCEKYLTIAILQKCGIEKVEDCEKLLQLLENAFQVFLLNLGKNYDLFVFCF